MRVLRDGVVLPAIVRAGKTVAVTASAPFRTLVVTKMPVKLGQRAWPGHVIAEVDGRPVVLLRGKLPPYRDLHLGDTGPDVRELQLALLKLRYADYDDAGYFGPSTALALELLYQHLGYSVPLYRPPKRPGRPEAAEPQIYLPMGEVSYIPTASALVVTVSAKAGSTVAAGQAILRLATGHPYVTAMLSAHESGLARAGDSARIAAGSLRAADAGVVSAISSIPAYATHGGQVEYPVSVTPGHPLPQGLIGTTVRLTIWSQITNGPVLTAPLTAVFSGGAHGKAAYVVRVTARGRQRRIPIYTGPAAGGFVAIQAVHTGALRPGDHILIGVGR